MHAAYGREDRQRVPAEAVLVWSAEVFDVGLQKRKANDRWQHLSQCHARTEAADPFEIQAHLPARVVARCTRAERPA
eukprot:7382653-Prymnesium_polylepis.1